MKKKKPSTLAQLIKQAKREYDSWSPELRAGVVLEGTSAYPAPEPLKRVAR